MTIQERKKDTEGTDRELSGETRKNKRKNESERERKREGEEEEREEGYILRVHCMPKKVMKKFRGRLIRK